VNELLEGRLPPAALEPASDWPELFGSFEQVRAHDENPVD
jgi:hypothetical protein